MLRLCRFDDIEHFEYQLIFKTLSGKSVYIIVHITTNATVPQRMNFQNSRVSPEQPVFWWLYVILMAIYLFTDSALRIFAFNNFSIIRCTSYTSVLNPP